ncbi:hypothetical protein PENTCL1PPCAC_14833, partial [Pristionchus entomophagus]
VQAGPREDFIALFESLVSSYMKPNTGKAVDMVAQDCLALKSMDDITDHLMKEVIGLVPATKYLGAMGMLTTFQSCLKKAGSDMDRAIAAVGGAFKKQLGPLLTKVGLYLSSFFHQLRPSASACIGLHGGE